MLRGRASVRSRESGPSAPVLTGSEAQNGAGRSCPRRCRRLGHRTFIQAGGLGGGRAQQQFCGMRVASGHGDCRPARARRNRRRRSAMRGLSPHIGHIVTSQSAGYQPGPHADSEEPVSDPAGLAVAAMGADILVVETAGWTPIRQSEQERGEREGHDRTEPWPVRAARRQRICSVTGGSKERPGARVQ